MGGSILDDHRTSAGVREPKDPGEKLLTAPRREVSEQKLKHFC